MSTQDSHATDDHDPLMDNRFNEPSMQDRVDLIIHLLRNSDRVLTIMSDDAKVLRDFSHKLTRHDTRELHYAQVYPVTGMNAEDIVMHLARGWGVEVDFGETAMNALFQRLPMLLPDPHRAVAIIHFANTLPQVFLDGLIGFIQRLDQHLKGRVRLILIGSTQLSQRIAPIQVLSDAGQVYALHLQPLATTSATQGFVSAAATEVLKPKEAANKPTPRAAAKSSSNAGNTNNARGLLLGGLVVSLILAVVVAMLLRPDTPEAPKDTTVSIPLTATPTTTPEPPSEPSPVAEISPAIVETITQSAAPAANAETPTPAASLTDTPTQVTSSSSQPNVYAPVPAQALEPAPVSEAPVPANPAPKAQTKAEIKPKPVSSTDERFSASNASQYVVQIVTLGSTKTVKNYIKTHALENCQSFRQQRDDKELFTLTCGLYPNREAALAALSKLPSSVNAAKPYPRQIADIRKVMLP